MDAAGQFRMMHYSAGEVPAMRQELIAVHVDARSERLGEPFYSPERLWQRVESHLADPGFDLVAGMVIDQLVGYAFGSTLPADTEWWSGITGVEAGLTAETGSRTFAFHEILVRKEFQKRGFAHRLHDELLKARDEERAVLLVRSDNPARLLYIKWGWLHVGHRQPHPDSPRFESMMLPLVDARRRP